MYSRYPRHSSSLESVLLTFILQFDNSWIIKLIYLCSLRGLDRWIVSCVNHKCWQMCSGKFSLDFFISTFISKLQKIVLRKISILWNNWSPSMYSPQMILNKDWILTMKLIEHQTWQNVTGLFVSRVTLSQLAGFVWSQLITHKTVHKSGLSKSWIGFKITGCHRKEGWRSFSGSLVLAPKVAQGVAILLCVIRSRYVDSQDERYSVLFWPKQSNDKNELCFVLLHHAPD